MPAHRVTRRIIVAALLATGVLAFTGIFYSHLHRVAEARYADRDDATEQLLDRRGAGEGP